MKIQTSTLALIATISALTNLSPARAGTEIGNGGDAVVCTETTLGSTTIQSVQLLDYYEARAHQGLTLDLGGADLNERKKIAFVLNRLEKIDPYFSRELKDAVDLFYASMALVPNVDFVDVPDSQHIAIPKGCAIEQIAIQKQPKFPNEKFYFVSKDLWDLMSVEHRAGLVLHEVLYRKALSNGAKDSIGVRYFNGWLASRELLDLPLKDYAELLQNAMRTSPVLPVRGYALLPTAWDENGAITAGFLNLKLSEKKTVRVQQVELPLKEGSTLRFYPNGGPIEFAMPSQGHLIQVGSAYYMLGTPDTQTRWQGISFHRNGLPAQFNITDGSYPYLGKNLRLRAQTIELDESGVPSGSINLAQDEKVTLPSGIYAVSAGYVRFTKNGSLVSFHLRDFSEQIRVGNKTLEIASLNYYPRYGQVFSAEGALRGGTLKTPTLLPVFGGEMLFDFVQVDERGSIEMFSTSQKVSLPTNEPKAPWFHINQHVYCGDHSDPRTNLKLIADDYFWLTPEGKLDFSKLDRFTRESLLSGKYSLCPGAQPMPPGQPVPPAPPAPPADPKSCASAKTWRTDQNNRCKADFWPGCDRSKAKFCEKID